MILGKNNRTLIAAGMLILFMMGMTPRMFLHDIFTGHKHAVDRSDNTEIQPRGFQCDVTSLVAKAPFIDQEKFGAPAISISYFHSFSEELINYFYSEVFSEYSLRGPPVS